MSVRPHSFLFTSESVTEGHPDKVADQISDAVLDAHLAEDPHARVACEVLVATQRVVVAGEITSATRVDVEQVVRNVVRRIGYDRPGEGFDADNLEIHNLLHEQAAEIAVGVDSGGAGDQGLMFGFACDETPELMPLPLALAHRLTRRLSEARRSGELLWLRPDGKSQVTVEYRDGRPQRVAAVVVSVQHEEAIDNTTVHAAVQEQIIGRSIPASMLDGDTRYHINPAGRFTTGGPAVDSGLTGRKIIVDTYGGAAPHGGGAFSGKDATKVDRSAAYMARHLARAVVSTGLAKRALVQLAYAIGVAEPVSVHLDTQGTSVVPDNEIAAALAEIADLTPRGIIEHLRLRQPIFLPTAAFGHFGRSEPGFTWEQADGIADGLTARFGQPVGAAASQ